MQPVLETENLTVVLGNRMILDSISVEIQEGEIVAMIGPNGAGKTTFLKAALGLAQAREGTVRIFGKPLSTLGADRDRIGYVPQRIDLDSTIPVTVYELMGINTPKRYFNRANAATALGEVDADQLMHRQAGELSGGELQRVLIALNLLRDPRILFLDEPATGIDREGEKRFYEILETLRSKRAMAVLLVSHDISVVYRHASRVLCVNRRLMCQGPPGEILNDETLERLYGHATAVYEHHEGH